MTAGDVACRVWAGWGYNMYGSYMVSKLKLTLCKNY
jgi:hypothetical protein